MNYYILKEFVYYHNDYDGYVIDNHNFAVIGAFDDANKGKKAWIAKERESFDDIQDNYYEKVSDDFLDWINQKTATSFNDVSDFVCYFDDNPQYYETIKALSDDDFMTLLDKLNGHRFALVEISEEAFNKKRYSLDLYDSFADKYAPFCPNGRYVDNAPPLYVDDKEVFFDAIKSEKNNIAYLIEYEEMFYGDGCLTDEDLNNPQLQEIWQAFPDVFEIFGKTLIFKGVKQNELHALHKVNALLATPFFKITEHCYADLLNNQ